MNNKRYLIFGGDTNKKNGGWSDFKGSRDTIVEAAEIATDYKWAEIVDIETYKIIWSCGGN